MPNHRRRVALQRAMSYPALAWLLTSIALCAEASPTLPGSAAAPAQIDLQAQMNQPVTANFQEVDFPSAIAFLAENGGINIILSEKARQVGRPVTIHLVEMPLRRALEYLLKGQGFLYRFDDRAIWVATRDEMEAEPMETRVFFLNQGPGLFAGFQKLGEVRDSVALQAPGLENVKTIKDLFKELIPEVAGSSIQLDERRGALIVTHAPYYLQQIETLLKDLDVTPMQVLIEARFIEITLTNTNEWSVDGGLLGNYALTKQNQGDGTKSPGLQLSSLGSTLLRGTKVDFTNFANQTAGNGLNLTLQGVLSGPQYSAVLHALAEDKRSKTLSAPRVTTLNNETATIKIVTEYVYPTRYQATVIRQDLNGNGTFTDIVNGVPETRFVNVPQDFVTKDLGIVLHVTPSVGQDHKTITLGLKPEVSEKKTDDTFGGEVTLPRFTSRNLETSVVIENGETIMLGGLMSDATTKTRTKVPFLGSLPVVGALFRKDNNVMERSNLLIFVTAQLVSPDGARLAYHEEN